MLRIFQRYSEGVLVVDTCTVMFSCGGNASRRLKEVECTAIDYILVSTNIVVNTSPVQSVHRGSLQKDELSVSDLV